MNRTLVGVGTLGLLLVGCRESYPPGRCGDQQYDEALSPLLDFGEWGSAQYVAVSQPDAGVVWWAASKQPDGWLYLRLHPSALPMQNGKVPRTVASSSGCLLEDTFFFRPDDGGVRRRGKATLHVRDGGFVTSHTLDLDVAGMSMDLPDGGAIPISGPRRVTWDF